MVSKLNLSKAVKQIKASSEEICGHISWTESSRRAQRIAPPTSSLNGSRLSHLGSDNTCTKVLLSYIPLMLQPVYQIQPISWLRIPTPTYDSSPKFYLGQKDGLSSSGYGSSPLKGWTAQRLPFSKPMLCTPFPDSPIASMAMEPALLSCVREQNLHSPWRRPGTQPHSRHWRFGLKWISNLWVPPGELQCVIYPPVSPWPLHFYF